VTDVPHWLNARSTPLKFRFLVAMTGSLGIGSNLNKMSEEDMSTSAKMVALYKEIRPTIQNGLLYRLQSPVGSEFSATEYVSRDAKEVVLFGFLHSQQFGRQMPTIFLQGLVPDATYRVRTTDGDLKGLDSVSGAYLMHHGIELNLRGDYDSTVVILERTR
jgi:alpha-galactosidase